MLAVDASDGELARMVAGRTAGEAEEAEAELYRRFAFRIRLYGLRHLGDEDRALDLVQQVMLVTIEKLRQGAVRDGNQIGSFILGTSRTMAIDLKRKERRRERLREAFRPHATVAAEPDAALDLDRVESCLAQWASATAPCCSWPSTRNARPPRSRARWASARAMSGWFVTVRSRACARASWPAG